MNKLNVPELFNSVRKGIVKHSPEILTAIGITGMVTTTVLAVKATPKAMKLIKEAKEAKQEELTKKEVIKAAWKPYIPAMVTGVTSTACLIGASNVNARRNAALATAYQISTTALSEYKDKVVETIGEEKAKEIKEKIVKDHEENLEASRVTYVIADDAEITILEPVTKQEFKSTTIDVREKILDINDRMVKYIEPSVSFNEYLYALNLEPTDAVVGDSIGWNTNNLIEITFVDSHTKRNKPCFEIKYLTPPEHGFDEY